jgi:hypothetical protein
MTALTDNGKGEGNDENKDGTVVEKGQAVEAGWAWSGFFDCVRRKGAPDFAQNDGFVGG